MSLARVGPTTVLLMAVADMASSLTMTLPNASAHAPMELMATLPAASAKTVLTDVHYVTGTLSKNVLNVGPIPTTQLKSTISILT